jgi:hypothetical protein
MTTIRLTEQFDEIRLASEGLTPEIQRVQIKREAKNSIFQHPPSLFWWPITEIGPRASLDFAIAINPAVQNQIHTSCDFRVWLAMELSKSGYLQVCEPIRATWVSDHGAR